MKSSMAARTSGKSRRRFARRDVNLPVSVRVNGREHRAVALNISPGGAFLRVSLPEPAAELEALIELPHGKGLHVRARVCWKRGDPAGVGVRFEAFLER